MLALHIFQAYDQKGYRHVICCVANWIERNILLFDILLMSVICNESFLTEGHKNLRTICLLWSWFLNTSTSNRLSVDGSRSLHQNLKGPSSWNHLGMWPIVFWVLGRNNFLQKKFIPTSKGHKKKIPIDIAIAMRACFLLNVLYF